MKPIVRYQSQLLFRKCYKPTRLLRLRPGPSRISFRAQRDRCGTRMNSDLMFLISY